MQSLIDTLIGAVSGGVVLLAVAVLRFVSQDKKVWVDRQRLQHDISQELMEDLREEREEAEERADEAEAEVEKLETRVDVLEQKWEWAVEQIRNSSIDADPSDAPPHAEDCHV